MHPMLRLYEDSISGGAAAVSLPALARMIFVVHGAVAIEGKTLGDGEAWNGEGAGSLAAGKDGVTLWRFELGPSGSNSNPLKDSIELMGAPMQFSRNEEIYGESEPADYFYKVISGTVRTYKVLNDGRRQIESGSVFSALGMPVAPHSASNGQVIFFPAARSASSFLRSVVRPAR